MILPGMNPSFASLPGVTPAATVGSGLGLSGVPTGLTMVVPPLCPGTLLPQLLLLLLLLVQVQGTAPRPSLVLGCKDKTPGRCCTPDLTYLPSSRTSARDLAVGSFYPVRLPHTDLPARGESLGLPQPSHTATEPPWPLPAGRMGPFTECWVCSMEPGEPETFPSLQKPPAGQSHVVPQVRAHGGLSLFSPCSSKHQ